jgi:hypothetical protein
VQDGMANQGVGKVENQSNSGEARFFYSRVAELAKKNGVQIAVCTFEGEDCR